MSTGRITSAIFDMDGLLIDSEPLWLRGELEVFSQLGLNVHDDVPETLGLRIDQVVRIWYLRQPWQGPSQQVVCQRILDRVLSWCGRPVRCCRAPPARCSCVALRICASG